MSSKGQRPDLDDDSIIVCLPTAKGNPGGFDDNVYGSCDSCQVPIQWRPHNPPGRHLCLDCVVKMPNPGKIVVTMRTILEVLAVEARCANSSADDT
jgi:hypothetical protein